MKILFAADMSFNYFEDNYPGDEAAVTAMKEAKACFDKADFSVVNFESVLANPKDFTPIKKSGPNIASLPAFKKYIEVLSPSAMCLANNHTGDFGEQPIFNTLNTLKEMGIKTFGAGANIKEAYIPVTFEKDGERIAVIGVCENEFGGAGKDSAGSAGYSLGLLSEAIRKAIDDNYTPVVFFHGGNEHNPFPSPGKRDLYRNFIDIGAGAVIAMHTHCPQGYETYRNAPIIYSMGNFFFPAPDYPYRPRFASWHHGYMSLLTFENKSIKIETIPYKQDFEGVHILSGEDKAYFEKYLDAISEPINDTELLNKYFDAWCGRNDILNAFVYEKAEDVNLARIRNILSCEAHNEVCTRCARMIFDGRNDPEPKLTEDILALQDMKIPSSLLK